jgi:hypothetical protein
MAIVWSKEVPKGRTLSGNRNDGAVYRREFLVRVDAINTSLIDISNAPGCAFGDEHPDDPSVFMDRYDVKPADDSGLLYLCSYEYRKQNPQDQEPPEGEPGGLDFRPPVWSGSSGVVTRPVYKDRNGDIMTNSAGDPLEDLEAEQAEERLTLTQYFLSHTGWLSTAKTYTNAVNNAAWNGGAEHTWKCQGCSKKLNIENRNGVTVIYWEITWEFAYKADNWKLKPWDIGFHELVDEATGEPSGTGTKRAVIKTYDGKGTRQPVALGGGVALPPGTPPVALEFEVYEPLDFLTPFGELFTPSVNGGA